MSRPFGPVWPTGPSTWWLPTTRRTRTRTRTASGRRRRSACSGWRPRCPSCSRRWSTPVCSTGPVSLTGCRCGPRRSGGSPSRGAHWSRAHPRTWCSTTPGPPGSSTPPRPPHSRGTLPTPVASSPDAWWPPSCAATRPCSTGSSHERRRPSGDDPVRRPAARLPVDVAWLARAFAQARAARAGPRAARGGAPEGDAAGRRPLLRYDGQRRLARPGGGAGAGQPQHRTPLALPGGSGRDPARGQLPDHGLRAAGGTARPGDRRQGRPAARAAGRHLAARRPPPRQRFPAYHRQARQRRVEGHHRRAQHLGPFDQQARQGAHRMTPTPALLVLEDGRTFHGEAFGAEGETFGEAVFSTGMSGYQETLTDPSYHRQVVVMTAPHVGNTGMNDEDAESRRIWVSGYVVRDPARIPSSWRSRRSLDDALREQGVVGISGVDTRALTRHLRDRGAMRVGISTTETDPAALLDRVRSQPAMTGADLAGEVTTPEAYVVPAVGEKRFTVAALDLGIK